MKTKAYMNWSGGKDSSLALYCVLKSKEFEITHLLTSVNDEHDRISMHGVRSELLRQQAESIGIPLIELRLGEMPTMEAYNKAMSNQVAWFTNKGITNTIFGDIFLEDLRKYREDQLLAARVKAHFPIWKKNTTELLKEFIALGFKTILVCVNEKHLDKSFVGRVIDDAFLNDLPKEVDPCGENGEFHTFVYDGPIFQKPIQFELGEVVHRKYERKDTDNDVCGDDIDPFETGFFYQDLIPFKG